MRNAGPSGPHGPSSLQEFVKDAGSYSKKLVDDLLDQITGGDHSRMLFRLRQVGASRECARAGSVREQGVCASRQCARAGSVREQGVCASRECA